MKLYEQAAQEQEAAEGSDANAGTESSDDSVVDADFEEVEDEE